MSHRATSKKKVAKPKRAETKPKGRAETRVPLTNDEMQDFVDMLQTWWSQLGQDVKSVEKLLERLPAGEPLSPDAELEFHKLVDAVKRDLACPYPYHPHDLCVQTVDVVKSKKVARTKGARKS